jgi:hypothetical protein
MFAYIQNRVIAESWNRGITVRNVLPTLLNHIALADTWSVRDTRSIAFSIIFFFAALAPSYLGRKNLLKIKLADREEYPLLALFGLVAVFGYLIHFTCIRYSA